MSVTIDYSKPVETYPEQSKIHRRHKTVSDSLQASDLHPVLKQLYANRGITEVEDVHYAIDQLPDYKKLKDIECAADIIASHVQDNKKILIIGDFDADGATSSAVVVRALRLFGAKQVGFLVPNRFEYGYGLSPEIVALADEQSPALIITVDNGISSIEGVAEAVKRNIRVVVTDHHLPGEVVPSADAIVNPNQAGCLFPFKNTAGVGVAFYVMLAVRAKLREQGWFENHTEVNMASLLDLVALGTVADVVPMDRNNRLLVELGLRRIRQNRGCTGINALLTIAGKQMTQCNSQDFGFVIGPRLNAAGRLEDMSIGINCLLTDDYSEALKLASELDEINHQRKQIEGDMLRQAMNVLERDFFQSDTPDNTLVNAGLAMFHPDWHQGVVGLVASRVKEKFHRPVFVFASAEEKGILKGSGRSIIGLHLRDTLDRMEKLQPGLMLKFGGHAMAAGLSIKEKNFAAFQLLFNQVVSGLLDESTLTMTKESDGALPESMMTLDVAELLTFSGPWGQTFPVPLFDDVFEVANWRIVGEKHLKMSLKQVDSQQTYDAIAFNMTESSLPAGSALIRACYRLDVNEYRGNRRLQLIIDYIEPVEFS